ncbi:spore cortex-lytic enzyme [Desulfotomaculum sp. 1211_IL3151]|uniref:spore cortex-lytic enzyme n=1 Tax=Desulfotomaculum sp. 1211_IL3151 TaxID=3084055 RepID=UPI002FD8DE63
MLIIFPIGKAEAYLGDRTIKYGMQGYDVQQLQKNLNYLGYQAGNADGIYGWRTLSAIKQFQGKNGLKVDGIVGKATANLLISQVSGNNSSRPKTTDAPAAIATTSRGSLPLSRADLYDLARVVHGEARGESFEGQVAVAAVVLNRVLSGQFGRTIQEVIFQPWAFTAVNDGQFYLQPNASAMRAVEEAIKGWDPSRGALYYWNPKTATSKWIWSRPISLKIGNHVFAS